MEFPATLTAQAVGEAFAHQFYANLRNQINLCVFYKDNCTIARPGLHGMWSMSTFPNVNENDINMLSHGSFKSVELTSTVCQEDSSGNGNVLVVVGGLFTLNEGGAKNFTQSFCLAPQENKFFVTSDTLSFNDAIASIWNTSADQLQQHYVKCLADITAIDLGTLPPNYSHLSSNHDPGQIIGSKRGHAEVVQSDTPDVPIVARSNQLKTGHWSQQEHILFEEAIKKFGEKDYQKIAKYVGTRNAKQAREHGKYFLP